MIQYKQTEIGKIPKEWNKNELREMGKVSTGKTPSTSKSIFWNGDIPFITPAEITDSKYVEKTCRFVTDEGARQVGILPKDTVLAVCIGSTIGKTAITVKDSITNQQINSIKCNKNINSTYVYYALSMKSAMLKNYSGVAAVPIIKKSLFEKIKLPIPPLPEQKKIAEILSTADDAIQKVDEAIKKTERIKQGLMQKLLTEGIGHKDFKETKIGSIPTEWEVSRLGDIGTLQYGYTCSATNNNTGVHLLRITDIEVTGSVKWLQIPFCKVSSNEFEKYKLFIGDILFARIGSTTGKAAYIDQESSCIFASYLIRFKSMVEHINTKFLHYFTQSKGYWHQALKSREGQLKKGLNTKTLSAVKLSLPPLPEQQKIAEILGSVDEKLDLLKKKKERFENIKKGLMNDLLTGRKRV